MTRRRFLTTATKLSSLAVFSGMPVIIARAGAADEKVFAPRPGIWRTYELTTRVDILFPDGVTRVWLPVPAVSTDYQKVGDNRQGRHRSEVLDRYALRRVRQGPEGSPGRAGQPFQDAGPRYRLVEED